MPDITLWTDRYIRAVKAAFGERIWFAGIQGSYGRGEAAEDSDIDMVLILDALTPQDIAAYDAVLGTLEHRELACGFLSGRAEIMGWEPSDLFQFCHDTVPIIGTLGAVLALVDSDAVARAVLIGACNIYHGCVHNMLYRKDGDALRGLYKSAAFVVRARIWQRTGRYAGPLGEAAALAEDADRQIVSAYATMRSGGPIPFAALSEKLFRWAGGIITAGGAGK